MQQGDDQLYVTMQNDQPEVEQTSQPGTQHWGFMNTEQGQSNSTDQTSTVGVLQIMPNMPEGVAQPV